MGLGPLNYDSSGSGCAACGGDPLLGFFYTSRGGPLGRVFWRLSHLQGHLCCFEAMIASNLGLGRACSSFSLSPPLPLSDATPRTPIQTNTWRICAISFPIGFGLQDSDPFPISSTKEMKQRPKRRSREMRL